MRETIVAGYARRLFRGLPMVASIGLMATPAQAQDTGTAETEDRRDVIVVTGARDKPIVPAGSRLGIPVLDNPASIQVISGDLIRARGDFSVQEAVTRAAGVTDQGSSGNGGLALSARGFTGVNSVMRLYDGLQMVVAAGTMTFPSDTWTVDRIEVLGGASSVLYGSGAIGGAVNVVPLRPDMTTHHHKVRLGVGTYGSWRAALDTTGPISDQVGYRIAASRDSSEGWTDRGESSSVAVSAALRYEPIETISITLSQDYGDQKPANVSAIPLINGEFDKSLRFRNYNFLGADLHYKDSWTQLKTEWTPSETFSIRNTAYYLHSDRRWHSAGSPSYVPDENMVLRGGGTDLTHDLEQIGTNITAMLSTPIAGMTNRIAVGAEYAHTNFKHVYWVSRATSLVPLDGQSPGVFIPTPGGYNYINRFLTDQFALFAEDQLSITPELSLVAGLRWDNLKVDRLERLTGVTSDATFNPLSWRVGTVYSIGEAFNLYAQYSTATDPPGSIGNMSASAQRMKLMSGRQIEVGAKHIFPNNKGEITLTAYRIVKNDLLVPVPDQPGVTQQVGQQSSRGIEAAVTWTPTESLRFDVNGAILEAEFDDFWENVGGTPISREGNTPPSVPQRVANLWVMWEALPEWTVRGGLRYVGQRYSDNANLIELDDYVIADGGVNWRMSDRMSLDLRISNIFDKFYFPQGGSSIALRPAPPRTADLTLNMSF